MGHARFLGTEIVVKDLTVGIGQGQLGGGGWEEADGTDIHVEGEIKAGVHCGLGGVEEGVRAIRTEAEKLQVVLGALSTDSQQVSLLGDSLNIREIQRFEGFRGRVTGGPGDKIAAITDSQNGIFFMVSKETD